MASKDKGMWGKIWHFIWKDDSLLSWVVNIILAFLIVKFIVYPGLGLLFSTTHPVVAVVSGSMEHDGDFELWWSVRGGWYKERGYDKETVKDWSFSNGFNKGDIMVLLGVKIEDVKVGDVVVFNGNSREPIIHRVIATYSESGVRYVQTKGDHNPDSLDALGENQISQKDLIGKAIFRVPLLGWIKIFAVDFVNLVKGGEHK